MTHHVVSTAGSNVTVSAVHPGLVNTEIGRHMSIYNSWTAMLLLKPLLWLVLKTPRQGAQTSLYAALSPDATNSGAYYRYIFQFRYATHELLYLSIFCGMFCVNDIRNYIYFSLHSVAIG